MTDKVKISRGNTKLGKMPNVSLVPVKDCGNCSHCAADCYALKAFRQYPATRAAWQHNSAIFRAGGYTAIADDIVSQLEKRPSRFFRIHVAGDFLSQEHVDLWKVIARRLPSTTFLAFTKMHSLDYSRRPKNLTIVFSMWPGMEKGRKKMPRAWYQDGTETRIPADAIECPGKCEGCGLCWNLADVGRDVYFRAH